MSAINGINSADASLYIGNVTGTNGSSRTQDASKTLPSGTASDPILDDLDLPELPLSMRGVSIDSLLSAISDESRRNGIQAAVDNIETQGEAMEAENAKKLEEIKKQLDELKSQSIWDKFCKVFKVIGAVFGALASTASIVVGAATGNPLLITAGVMGAVASVDGIVSLASDGKYSIAAGFTELGKAMGMSDEAAQWFGFGVNMAFIVSTMIIGFAGAVSAAGSSVASAASKVINTTSKLATATNVGSGVTGVAQGITSAGLAISAYKVAQTKAKQVDIDAVLETIRNNIKMNKDLIDEEMQAADNLISAVKDIVEDCSQTATALLTAAPATA